MNYILLGKLNAEWVKRSDERVRAARRQLERLGIKLEAVWYTQGAYDFVDRVSCKDPSDVLAFSVWYASEGYGSITTLPAFSGDEMDQALGRLKSPKKK